MSTVMRDYKFRGTVARVVDGDTLDVNLDLGFHINHRIRVRLLGVDTPEVFGANACEEGKEASLYVKALCPTESTIFVATYKTGKYGRWLARITLPNGQVLNDLLIEKGWPSS
jgi:micrococcal nuclease